MLMLKWDKRLEKTGSLSKDMRFHELRKVLTIAKESICRNCWGKVSYDAQTKKRWKSDFIFTNCIFTPIGIRGCADNDPQCFYTFDPFRDTGCCPYDFRGSITLFQKRTENASCSHVSLEPLTHGCYFTDDHRICDHRIFKTYLLRFIRIAFYSRQPLSHPDCDHTMGAGSGRNRLARIFRAIAQRRRRSQAFHSLYHRVHMVPVALPFLFSEWYADTCRIIFYRLHHWKLHL